MRKTKSSKTASAIALGITLTLVLVLLGGLMASVITKTSPVDWFNKELVATTEEEMNELLTEENIGKSVKYAGETLKKVELPYAVGDEITSVYFDTKFDFGTFVQNLDWENAHVKGLDFESTTSDVICLVGTINYEGKGFDEYLTPDNGDDIDENLMKSMLLWVMKVHEYDTGDDAFGVCDIYMIHSREEDTPYFGIYVDADGKLIDVYCSLPEGFNGGPLDNGNSFVIDYINPAMMQEDALFIGVEDGKYGTVETVFEKDQVYTIEKAEDGTLAFVIAE